MRVLLSCGSLCLVVLATACSGSSGGGSAGDGAGAGPTVATTAPVEIVESVDQVRVGPTGISDASGTALLTFDQGERACIDATAGTVADLSATLTTPTVGELDPDAEQTLSEIVVGCVPFDRIQGLVTAQLAAQPDLEGVDPNCLAREVTSLQDTPDVLAAVLRGDPDALTVIAGTASTNCPP